MQPDLTFYSLFVRQKQSSWHKNHKIAVAPSQKINVVFKRGSPADSKKFKFKTGHKHAHDTLFYINTNHLPTSCHVMETPKMWLKKR